MPCTTRWECGSMRCRSRRRRCSRLYGERGRGKREGWDRRHSPTSRGPSRRACRRRGKAATARRWSGCMLRLPSFRYLEPKTLAEALRMKADAGPDGMYVAGGTDLYPNMKRRHQEPRVVISLMGIRELMSTEGRKDGMTVGSCVTLSQLSVLPSFRPSDAVPTAARLVSTPLLRNMGTIGGNLCLDTRCNYYNQSYEWRKSIDFCLKKDGKICWVATASKRCVAVSSTDTAPALIALNAVVKLVSEKGERGIPV